MALAGEAVEILEEVEENDSFLVFVHSVRGLIPRAAVVMLSDPAAAAKLLAAAWGYEQPGLAPDRPNDLAALWLYDCLRERFPDSKYAPLAFYRYGQVADRLAIQASRELNQAVEALKASPGSPKVLDETVLRPLEDKVLSRYAARGLKLSWSHLGGNCYYDGEVYRTLVNRFPRSAWADNAAFALLRRGEHLGGWEGWPTQPLKELGVWREFMVKYPKSELLPEAHLQIVCLDRALHEIYSFPQSEFRDAKKAAQHRQAAEDECRAILREYPGTVAAAQAEKHLAEMTEGIHIYIHGAGWSR